MREGETDGEVLLIGDGSGFQVGRRLGELSEAVVGHAEEDGIAHRFGQSRRRSFEQGREFGDSGFQLSGFEQSESQIETQTGYAGLEGEGLAVERDGFLV